MIQDLEWYLTHSERLSEPDRKRVSIEIQAVKNRNSERGKTKLNFLSNKEKVDVIKRWYPSAYTSLKESYPGFIEAPDDYPPAILMAVNYVVHLKCGFDYRELEMKY